MFSGKKGIPVLKVRFVFKIPVPVQLLLLYILKLWYNTAVRDCFWIIAGFGIPVIHQTSILLNFLFFYFLIWFVSEKPTQIVSEYVRSIKKKNIGSFLNRFINPHCGILK